MVGSIDKIFIHTFAIMMVGSPGYGIWDMGYPDRLARPGRADMSSVDSAG